MSDSRQRRAAMPAVLLGAGAILFSASVAIAQVGDAKRIDVTQARDRIIDRVDSAEKTVAKQVKVSGEDIVEAIRAHGEVTATNQERIIQLMDGLMTAKHNAEGDRQNEIVEKQALLAHPVSVTGCEVATASADLAAGSRNRQTLNSAVTAINDDYYSGQDPVSSAGGGAVGANLLRQRRAYAENEQYRDADIRASTVFGESDWDTERQKASILYTRSVVGVPPPPADLSDDSAAGLQRIQRVATAQARYSLAQTAMTDIVNARSTGFRTALKEQSYRLFGGTAGDPVTFHERLIELPPETLDREVIRQLALGNVLLNEILEQEDRQTALTGALLGVATHEQADGS